MVEVCPAPGVCRDSHGSPSAVIGAHHTSCAGVLAMPGTCRPVHCCLPPAVESLPRGGRKTPDIPATPARGHIVAGETIGDRITRRSSKRASTTALPFVTIVWHRREYQRSNANQAEGLR